MAVYLYQYLYHSYLDFAVLSTGLHKHFKLRKNFSHQEASAVSCPLLLLHPLPLRRTPFCFCDPVTEHHCSTPENDRIQEIHFQMHGLRVMFSSQSTLVPGETSHEIMCTGQLLWSSLSNGNIRQESGRENVIRIYN